MGKKSFDPRKVIEAHVKKVNEEFRALENFIAEIQSTLEATSVKLDREIKVTKAAFSIINNIRELTFDEIFSLDSSSLIADTNTVAVLNFEDFVDLSNETKMVSQSFHSLDKNSYYEWITTFTEEFFVSHKEEIFGTIIDVISAINSYSGYNFVFTQILDVRIIYHEENNTIQVKISFSIDFQ